MKSRRGPQESSSVSQEQMSATSEWLTVSEVAEILNVSERFVRRLVYENRIIFHHFGRLVRVNRRDCEAFAQAGRVDASR